MVEHQLPVRCLTKADLGARVQGFWPLEQIHPAHFGRVASVLQWFDPQQSCQSLIVCVDGAVYGCAWTTRQIMEQLWTYEGISLELCRTLGAYLGHLPDATWTNGHRAWFHVTGVSSAKQGDWVAMHHVQQWVPQRTEGLSQFDFTPLGTVQLAVCPRMFVRWDQAREKVAVLAAVLAQQASYDAAARAVTPTSMLAVTPSLPQQRPLVPGLFRRYRWQRLFIKLSQCPVLTAWSVALDAQARGELIKVMQRWDRLT